MEDKDELVKKVHAAAEVIADGEQKRSKEDALNQCVTASFADTSVSDLATRICISPQCGFASHSDGNPVTEDDVVKKLRLVVDTAKAIWTDA